MLPAYRSLFQVTVEHAYFGPGPWHEPRWVPTPATRAFLDRRGFRWVAEGITHTLYAESQRLASGPAHAAWVGTVPESLSFCLETSWTAFGWATPTPASTEDEIAVYHARLERADETAVAPEGPILVGIRSARFRLRAGATTRPGATVRVFDGSGNPAAAVVERIGDGWRIDLGDQDPGYYRLDPDDGPEVWVLTEPALALRKPLLVLAVHGLAEQLAAADGAEIPTSKVRLMLPSRETVWRYHVFNAGLGHEGYGIEPARGADATGGGAGPRFRRVPGVRDLDGQLSLCFEADRPIPLRSRPQERFQLVRNDGVLVNPLPLPGPALAAGRDRDRDRAWSEMMVHL